MTRPSNDRLPDPRDRHRRASWSWSSRSPCASARPGPRPSPPPGVHLPPGSLLPVIFSIGAALLGLGLVFKPDEPYPWPVLDTLSRFINPFLAIAGLAGAALRHRGPGCAPPAASGDEVEAGPHHDAAGH